MDRVRILRLRSEIREIHRRNRRKQRERLRERGTIPPSIPGFPSRPGKDKNSCDNATHPSDARPESNFSRRQNPPWAAQARPRHHRVVADVNDKNTMTTITDSDFSTFGSEKSKWAILTHNGVVMDPTLKDSILSLDISKTSGANWHGELRYSPFPVKVGDILKVSFSARAKHPFTFSVWLGQQNAPYKSLVSEDNHFGAPMMTTEWQTFTHTWHPFMDEELSRLNFVLGQIDTTVDIKGVALIKS